jgi:polysaccharide biosynthesis/export protein
MNRIVLFAFIVFAVIAPSRMVAAAEVEPAYQLHEGDTMTISVWKDAALQKKVVVLPDGSITFPLVGSIEVVGLTATEVEEAITQKLTKYIADPVVTVEITGIEGNRAFVIGKVIHPGPIIINGRITVLQAISIAGGFDKFADENNVKVIRHGADNTTLIYPVNYNGILSGTDVSTNIYLQAGDTIVVP